MTDKQIIIDGVDVSECKYFSKYQKIVRNNECIVDIQNACVEEIETKPCRQTHNCYFKNWQRKEQECEELKKELESTKGLVTVGNKKLKEYLKENISLKVQKERYCQVLSDIQDEARDGYCSGTKTGCENSLHRILQKINEVEDDKSNN